MQSSEILNGKEINAVRARDVGHAAGSGVRTAKQERRGAAVRGEVRAVARCARQAEIFFDFAATLSLLNDSLEKRNDF